MTTCIKRTRSLSADTLEPVAASVVEDAGCVFLLKDRDTAAAGRHRIETDAALFRRFSADYRFRDNDFDKVMVDVTTRCNMHCRVCYRRALSEQDLGMDTLRAIAGGLRQKIVSICGGEPTVREDLPEIIRLFSRRNKVFLITNGIRLADAAYVRRLEKSGLEYCSFSLNALDPDVLIEMHGEDVLAQKLAALSNLKRSRIKVILSAVLVRGVNERQVPKLFEYAVKNRDFIQELRIRAMKGLGHYLESERLCLSEMIDIVTGALGFPKDAVLREFELKRLVNGAFGREIFTVKSCSFDFHVRIAQEGVSPLGASISAARLAALGARKNAPLLLSELCRLYGVPMVLRGVAKLLFRRDRLPWFHSGGLLKVGLRCWPDVDTIDLEENRRCRTGYWLKGSVVSFCLANIIKDKEGR